jgi:hypothetical protein
MLEPTLYPDLPDSVPVRIAVAVLERLQADPALAAAGITVRDVETEDEAVRSEVPAPFVGVAIPGEVHNLKPGGWSELHTVLGIFLVTTIQVGTARYARHRLIERIKKLVYEDGGEILDEHGRQLTNCVKRFERINYDRRREPAGIQLTELRILYQTDYNEATREVLA